MRLSHVVAGIVLGFFGVTSAAAQTQSVVGKYYESVGFQGDCDQTSICTVRFLPNPVQSVILITRVQCQVSSTGPVFRATLQAHISDQTSVPLKVVALGAVDSIQTSQNSYAANINAETAMLLGIGRFPRVRVVTVGVTINLSCSISGIVVP